MKKTFLLIIISIAISVTLQAQNYRIASYNLRYDNEGDRPDNAWEDRYPHIVDVIKKHNIDVFGIQEGLFGQLSDLLRSMPDYEYTGLGREGAREGEHSAIWYKREKFILLDSGDFWLSETPEKLSKGWDAAFERLCSWAKFCDKESGFIFYFFNTHFDHKGDIARANSIHLIFEQIKNIAGNKPVVLTGDFNIGQRSKWYEEFNKYPEFYNAYDIALDLKNENTGTFNGFGKAKQTDERIDHVLLSKNFTVITYELDLNTYSSGKFPSDHFPIILDIQLKEGAGNANNK
ncbi:endonuclease/exonuclease/phosphatase family protein [Flavivirga sp. 57AJ16]|uniref:endonuclease/exonuclease/phosphatase family protein n=1 Tax=Flavivirga sp. 57AJ16 TaxID=3025307 RepID=UPI002367378B|nr:endonuclease/exonuclease/phosphatase family protein [Flavivirga sp. 57AJ16]MDD7886270.1 endonuclease/exonuclease/phosphatase family protein [Flavivirga sp. 57AJ16]